MPQGKRLSLHPGRKTHTAFIRDVNVFLENQRLEIGRILSELEREGAAVYRPRRHLGLPSALRQSLCAHLFQAPDRGLCKEGALGTANKYKATLVAFE